MMRQFGDPRMGYKKERKEVIVKNWLSRFDSNNHDEQTGKLIHAYEEEEDAMTNETPVTDERPANDVAEGATETTNENEEGTTTEESTETATSGAETGAENELEAVVKRIAKKKRAAAANESNDDLTQPKGNKMATKKTAAKKKGAAAKKAAPDKSAKKKAATGTAPKKAPYSAPDSESKCGLTLAFLNEQIKKKDIAEDEKQEKAELFEAAAKKFDTEVVTIRTYASDHRDKIKWRAAAKKKA